MSAARIRSCAARTSSSSRASPESSTFCTGFGLLAQASASAHAGTPHLALRMVAPRSLGNFPSAVERSPCAAGMHRVHCPAVLSILLTVVGLGLLIAAHEAGHLVLARLLGMRVETYSLGFGPRIAGFRRGETDYRLSAIPLGGYCKIAGFSPDESAAQDPADPGSYANKSAWRRFLVIAAGPGVNYLVAFLIIAALYASHGFLDLTTTRIEVIPGGPAAAAGLQTSDQVVAVDGVPVDSFDDLRRELRKADAPPARRFEVQRGGERHAVEVRPDNGVIGVTQDKVLVQVP